MTQDSLHFAQPGDDSPSLGPPATPASAPASQEGLASPFAASKFERPRRTIGERTVDWIVYPIINNFGVFAISVAATYLTSKGGPDEHGKLPFGKTGKFFYERGEWLKGQFRGMGMSDKNANMAKMVFFSFADGTLVAPFIKLLEDHREHMARWIDNKLGTQPQDDSVYKAEPKQTWGSVIEGRLLTSAIVVPVAAALSKPTGHSLNERWFSEPGLKTGEWLAARPKLAKYFGKLDIPELFKTVYFEAFYTSVCTAGLYLISRFIAKQHKQQEMARAQMTAIPSDSASVPASGGRQPEAPLVPMYTAAPPPPVKREGEAPVVPLPRIHIAADTHQARLGIAPEVQELTA